MIHDACGGVGVAGVANDANHDKPQFPPRKVNIDRLNPVQFAVAVAS